MSGAAVIAGHAVAAGRLEGPSARTSPVCSTHFCLAPPKCPLQLDDLLQTFASDSPGYVGGRFFSEHGYLRIPDIQHKSRVVAEFFHEFLH